MVSSLTSVFYVKIEKKPKELDIPYLPMYIIRRKLFCIFLSLSTKVEVGKVFVRCFGPLENVVRADVPPLFIEY